jgi:hypothetical protein
MNLVKFNPKKKKNKKKNFFYTKNFVNDNYFVPNMDNNIKT